MGKLNNGKWEVGSIITSDPKKEFIRPDSAFRHWIGNRDFPAEANRYHLYVSYACPWASRTLVVRSLKGLKAVISYSTVEPLMGENGWAFGSLAQETVDPINHAQYLYEIYQKADPHYTGKVTVPVLWDKHQKTIVNNESSEIMRMLNNEFNDLAQNQLDLYPKALQTEIDGINQFIYQNINNGVYQCGFAGSQESYDKAFEALFSALEELEARLSRQRYLLGKQLTEADWRLFTTLIRFDSVYVGHFKCNKRCLREYSNLWNYTKELYQIPGIKETVRFDQIKQHYYQSHKMINPTGIIAKGPDIDFNESHNRHR